MRQRWSDARLADPSIGAQGQLITALRKEFWIPDLYIRNGDDSFKSDDDANNEFLRIEKDGSVVYSQRIKSRVSCPMKLHHYPFDEQKCQIDIESCMFVLALILVFLVTL